MRWTAGALQAILLNPHQGYTTQSTSRLFCSIHTKATLLNPHQGQRACNDTDWQKSSFALFSHTTKLHRPRSCCTSLSACTRMTSLLRLSTLPPTTNPLQPNAQVIKLLHLYTRDAAASLLASSTHKAAASLRHSSTHTTAAIVCAGDKAAAELARWGWQWGCTAARSQQWGGRQLT